MNSRTVLGMIGCLVLGDEMAYVIENDPAVENILVVDNPEGRAFLEKLNPLVTGKYVVLVDPGELERIDLSGPSVIVWMNGGSLHDDPRNLLETLASQIYAIEEFCGSVLLFYGQCRNTKYEVKRFAERFDLPVTFLTDVDGNVVDDCFAAFVGGRSSYMEMIREHKRTMFLTPGYADYWAKKYESKSIEDVLRMYENMQAAFESSGYDKVLVLDNGLGDHDQFMGQTRTFAAMFDMSIERTRCDTTVFERSYRLAWVKMPAMGAARSAGEEIVLSRTLP